MRKSSKNELEEMTSGLSISEGSGLSSSPDKIELLHIKDGETINHPLLLIEGFCSKDRNQKLSVSPRSNAGSQLERGASKELEQFTGRQYKTSSSLSRNFVLIENNTECTSWPVVGGGFKALVTLCPGSNRLSIKTCIANEWKQKEINVNYQPLEVPRFVRIVYIKCEDSDGTFQAPPGQTNDTDIARQKLAFNARLLQTFTAHNLHQHGLGFHTFRLEENTEGKPLVHVFTSSLMTEEALGMTGGQLYDRFNAELATSSLYDPKCKLWAFMSFTKYAPPPPEEFNDRDIPTYVKGHTALGGGGLALFGTGGLHTWASSAEELVSCFTDSRMIDKRSLFDDSSHRGTYWANYATCLGASIHELGHCFDLAHTPKGIMGRGFDDMNCMFTLWKDPPREMEEERKVLRVDAGTQSNHTEGDSLTGERQVKRAKLEMQENKDHSTPTSVQSSSSLVLPRVDCPGMDVTDDERELGNGSQGSLVDDPSDAAIMARKESGVTSMPGDLSHGATWYRASAVLLRYHKWLSASIDQSDARTRSHPTVHWGRTVLGPVGNFGGFAQPNQTNFNDVRWLVANQELELGGYVIHADDEYVNCIQTIGRGLHEQMIDEGEKYKQQLSEPRGSEGVGRRFVFAFSEPDERLVGVDVRAGGWVDAIRLHTSVKSSTWMGGTGGDLYELRPPPGTSMTGLFGTAGEYVGSVGALLDRCSDDAADDDLIVDAPHGLRLIELHNKIHGEVYRHWEFLEDPPPCCYPLPRTDIMTEKASIQIIDDRGNICRTGHMYDYTDALIMDQAPTDNQDDKPADEEAPGKAPEQQAD